MLAGSGCESANGTDAKNREDGRSLSHSDSKRICSRGPLPYSPADFLTDRSAMVKCRYDQKGCIVDDRRMDACGGPDRLAVEQSIVLASSAALAAG